VRTFLAVALQMGRSFTDVVGLARAMHTGDRLGVRRSSRSIAESILDGARDRASGSLVRTVIDQQRRTESLTRLRPSRPGRTPQAVAAARRGDRVDA
jgi:hypothetical protein